MQSDAATTNAKMSTEAVFTLGNTWDFVGVSVHKWTTVNTGVKCFELVHF